MLNIGRFRREAAISMRAPDDVVENRNSGKFRSTMDFRGLIRVRAELSGMSHSITHLPQVHLSHNERPYVGKFF